MHNEYWIHRTTGLVWAVTLDNDAIQCAAGPLAARDADPELLGFLDYSPVDGRWIAVHRYEFGRIAAIDERRPAPRSLDARMSFCPGG